MSEQQQQQQQQQQPMRTIRMVINIGPVPEAMAVGFVQAQQADTGENRRGANAVMVDGILRSVLRGLDKGQQENLNAVGPFAEVMGWVSILGMIISNPGSTITAQVIDPTEPTSPRTISIVE